MRIALRFLSAVLILGIVGCTGLKDVPKSIWGSSTRVLEEKRINALTKTYDKGYWECIRTASAVAKKKYVIFKKDEVRGLMVIMGIPGSVNTTEVGVFFVELNDHQTRIELSSLSTNAKRLLAKGLFHGMDVAFGLVPPDSTDGFSSVEFQSPLTPEALVKAIEDDGFSVPSGEDALDSLNILLTDVKFYDNWTTKYKELPLSKDMLDLVNNKEKNADQVKLLNRMLLQETYPTVCPKIKAEKPVVTGAPVAQP
ncbi:MAG: hypothetical protein HQL15_09750 [Candidatus Omnitrophica bacterium]|nr:hypothetical protein [Candidatus Omnitrophota bacterium]